MVAIKELRIGNLVSTNCEPMNTSTGGMYEVLIIDSREKFGKSSGYVTITTDDPIFSNVGTWCQYLEPIPLTPELLEKCGFEYDNGKECWEMDGECVDINIHPKEIGIEVDCWENSLIKCKYLHQLQNMYYAITGEELEVKL